MYSRLLLQILALLLVATTSPALAIDIPFERGYLTGCSENYSVEGHVQASDPDIELVNRGMGNESVLYKILSGQKIKNRRLAHDGFNAEATQVFYLNEILAMTTGKIPGGAWNNADFYSRIFEIIRFVWNLDPETPEMYLFFQVEKTAKEITDQYPELSSLKMPDHASEKEAQAWYHERFNQLGRMLVLVRDSTLKPPTQKEILDAIAEGFISRGIGMATVAGNKIVDVTMPPDLSWMDEPNVERINPRYPISN